MRGCATVSIPGSGHTTGGDLIRGLFAEPIRMEWLLLSIFVAGVAVLLFQGYAVVLAFRMPRLDPDERAASAGTRRVSVVIAARNEEHDLPGCLDELLHQTLPPAE